MAPARKGSSAARDESLQMLKFPYEGFFSGKDSRVQHSETGRFESGKGLLPAGADRGDCKQTKVDRLWRWCPGRKLGT